MSKNQNKAKVTLELPAKIFPYPPIRFLTQEIISSFMDLSDKWLNRIELIVDELFNNAAEHGSSKDDTIKVVFDIIMGEKIVVSVEDKGSEGNKSLEEIHEHITEHQKNWEINKLENQTLRGRGLANIVTKWADKWEITKNKENKGLCFKVEINNKDNNK
jgi:anti-sigma regulatory factor (Ser/Thr protein kinase)